MARNVTVGSDCAINARIKGTRAPNARSRPAMMAAAAAATMEDRIFLLWRKCYIADHRSTALDNGFFFTRASSIIARGASFYGFFSLSLSVAIFSTYTQSTHVTSLLLVASVPS